MRIHKEGYSTLRLLLLVILVLTSLVWIVVPLFWLNSTISFILLISFLFIVRFFRDPKRVPKFAEDGIIAPADGLIVSVTENFESEYFKDNRQKIALFMSGYDVHINWTPVSGDVKYFVYYPGKHLFARNNKSSKLNERTSIVITQSSNRILLMRQIAGVMARRIVSKVSVGQRIEQCEEIGFIKLGSRVELFLPLNSEVLVKPGQKVIGSNTILAKWGD